MANERLSNYYRLTVQWLKVKNRNKDIADYFRKNNYHSVAIYGLGELGIRLCEELIYTEIKIAYLIDGSVDEAYFGPDGPKHINLEDEPFQIDADVIIITPVYDFQRIKDRLLKKGININIVSLNDVIYGI